MTAAAFFLSTSNSPVEAGIAIVAGVASLAIAFLNPRFYWRKGWMSGDKPAPRWAGGLLFGIFGVLAIAVGVRDLWFRN
jgi:hypothetical protein